MSIIRQLPDNSRIRFPQTRFSANFNIGTGVYDFNVIGNVSQTILDPLQKNSLYLIERFEFRSSLPEGDWLESQLAFTQWPFFRIFLSDTLAINLYAEPVRCMLHRFNVEHLMYFKPSRQGQTLRATFRGQVGQIPVTVGKLFLDGIVTWNIYQIWDKQWIQQFEDRQRAKLDQMRTGLPPTTPAEPA